MPNPNRQKNPVKDPSSPSTDFSPSGYTPYMCISLRVFDNFLQIDFKAFLLLLKLKFI